jgi:hypothetical protein
VAGTGAVYDSSGGPKEPILCLSNERLPPMTRSLKLSAIVSLVAYAGGTAALLWRR